MIKSYPFTEWGAKRLIELSELVAPRASVFQGAERVPITDAIESIRSFSTRHSVLLDGVAFQWGKLFEVAARRVLFLSM